MVPSHDAKYGLAIAPAAIIDDAAATGIAIDCVGAASAEIMLHLGATDIALTVCKLTECDTSGGTYTDVTGGDRDGDLDFDGSAMTLPSATDDNKTFVWQVNLIGKKRFLKLAVTVGDGTAGAFVTADYRLSDLSIAPETSTGFAGGGLCRC